MYKLQLFYENNIGLDQQVMNLREAFFRIISLCNASKTKQSFTKMSKLMLTVMYIVQWYICTKFETLLRHCCFFHSQDYIIVWYCPIVTIYNIVINCFFFLYECTLKEINIKCVGCVFLPSLSVTHGCITRNIRNM